MLTEIVTRALSQLTGRTVQSSNLKGHFRYAYASDDGKYVALVLNDQKTYVVDVADGRFCAEGAVTPCGFKGHVLEVEGDLPARSLHAPYVEHFELDLDQDALNWRHCPQQREAA